MIKNPFQTLLFSPRLAPLRALGFTAILLVITWLALSPHPPAQATLGWDKANHASAFGTLALLARLSWPRRSWALVALVLLAYGGAIELIQSQIPEREASWLDLFADSVGISLGLLLYAFLQRFRPAANAEI